MKYLMKKNIKYQTSCDKPEVSFEMLDQFEKILILKKFNSREIRNVDQFEKIRNTISFALFLFWVSQWESHVKWQWHLNIFLVLFVLFDCELNSVYLHTSIKGYGGGGGGDVSGKLGQVSTMQAISNQQVWQRWKNVRTVRTRPCYFFPCAVLIF